MENQKKEITQTIQTYVDGYLNAKPELVAKAFHPETRLYSVEEGQMDKTEMNDWMKNLTERNSKGDIRSARFEMGLIDITEQTAIAKIFLHFETKTFVDYLSLLYVNKNWVIVGKIYSVKMH